MKRGLSREQCPRSPGGLNWRRRGTLFLTSSRKRGPLLRQFKPPGLRGHCSRESPLFIPEQFTFYEIFRNGGTVNLDKRIIPARAVSVNRIGYEIFAGARFPRYEHGCRRRRHSLDRIIDFQHGFTGTDYSLPVYIIGADEESSSLSLLVLMALWIIFFNSSRSKGLVI